MKKCNVKKTCKNIKNNCQNVKNARTRKKFGETRIKKNCTKKKNLKKHEQKFGADSNCKNILKIPVNF